MKVKEIPPSLYHTLKLRAIPAHKLRHKTGKEIPVIVSLTTIPFRLNKLHIVIRSILVQETRPQKIVLWLHESLKNQIPDSLKVLEGDIFEVRFSTLDCPHLKLVESLKSFPDKVIVTCDDDFIYPKDWLMTLYDEHLKKPGTVVAITTRLIRYDREGNVLPYKSWNYKDVPGIDEKAILPIGSSGVLYPPDSFHPSVTDEKLFLKLSPKADDLWFKAMSLLNDTPSVKVRGYNKEVIPIIGTQGVSLKKQNIRQDKNREQWQALADYFGITLFKDNGQAEGMF